MVQPRARLHRGIANHACLPLLHWPSQLGHAGLQKRTLSGWAKLLETRFVENPELTNRNAGHWSQCDSQNQYSGHELTRGSMLVSKACNLGKDSLGLVPRPSILRDVHDRHNLASFDEHQIFLLITQTIMSKRAFYPEATRHL